MKRGEIMKKIICLSLAGLLYLGIASLSFAMMCGGGHGSSHKGEAIAQSEETIDAGNKICPVSGEHIKEGKEIKIEHEGKTYNLCCKMCEKDFKKNPKKYIEKLEAQEKAAGEHEGHSGHLHKK